MVFVSPLDATEIFRTLNDERRNILREGQNKQKKSGIIHGLNYRWYVGGEKEIT